MKTLFIFSLLLLPLFSQAEEKTWQHRFNQENAVVLVESSYDQVIELVHAMDQSQRNSNHYRGQLMKVTTESNDVTTLEISPQQLADFKSFVAKRLVYRIFLQDKMKVQFVRVSPGNTLVHVMDESIVGGTSVAANRINCLKTDGGICGNTIVTMDSGKKLKVTSRLWAPVVTDPNIHFDEGDVGTLFEFSFETNKVSMRLGLHDDDLNYVYQTADP